MTATPLRQAQRHPAPSRPAATARALAAPLPSARHTGLGLLLGLVAVVVAFAGLPLALSQPLLGISLLLIGVALLAALLLRQGRGLSDPPPASERALNDLP